MDLLCFYRLVNRTKYLFWNIAAPCPRTDRQATMNFRDWSIQCSNEPHIFYLPVKEAAFIPNMRLQTFAA